MEILALCRDLGLPIETITLILVVFLYRKNTGLCKRVDKISAHLWEHVLNHPAKKEG